MRVLPIAAIPSARRFLTVAAALTVLTVASGCRELINGPDAESISLAPTNFEVPVNGSVRVVGTAFDKNGNTLGDKTIKFSSSNTTVATVTADGLVIGVSVGSAVIAGEANGARGETTVTVVPEIPSSILVTPAPVTLRRGNVRQFTATPRNATGTAITGLNIVWQSSNSAIASVSPTGEVTAVAPGNVVIAASVNQVSGSSQVTVTEIPIGSISLSPLTKGIQVNETFIPDVTLRDTASNAISSLGRSLNWTSSNELNATVSSAGVVTGRRAGTARITAASPDNPAINGTMDVTITDRVVKTVVITPRTGSLRLSLGRQLNAQLLDSLNQNVTGRVVTWTSLTPTIASVSANGTATGLSLGTARITARVDDAADTVTFNVTRIPVGEITLSPPQASVIQGKTVTLSATVRDSVGTEVTDRTLTWLTSNQNVASVVDGTVTGISTGTATITATAENRSGTASITVLQGPVDSIRLANPADATFTINAAAPGNSRQVQLELLDAEGLTVLGRNLLITSSSPSVANASWNQNTRILTVTATAGTNSGSTTISLRALGQNGNPEGKTTEIVVSVTSAP
jgi:trimeric autotransporter adhesin